jgi:hypothetical protein
MPALRLPTTLSIVNHHLVIVKNVRNSPHRPAFRGQRDLIH